MNKISLKKKLIGSCGFYSMIFAIAVPIMVQNGITNFVSMIDNIMVGRVGTNEMSGVAIVNQLIMVFNLCIFGGVAGAGIFTAQFHGARNTEGIRYTFRYKIIVITVITALSIAIFLGFGEELIKLYLHGEGGAEDAIASTLHQAKIYLGYMLIGLPPFAIAQAYGDTLRCSEETIVPMKAGVASVFVNLSLNYVLIYGKFGAPALGVAGAAIATIIARYVEMAYVVVWTHTHSRRQPFIKGAFKSLKIPLSLAKDMIAKGTPLILNETLWSMGVAALLQNYSVRGLAVVGALNISQIISNLFNVGIIAMGSAISIILGRRLGAGEMEEAKEYSVKLIFFTEIICICTSTLLLLLAPFFPMIYNTTDEIKELATSFIRVAAACMPIYAFETCCYFTIRSGGKTLITFLFDSVFMCIVSVPVAYVLVHFTPLYIVVVFLFVQLVSLIKCVIGFVMVKKGIWLNKLAY